MSRRRFPSSRVVGRRSTQMGDIPNPAPSLDAISSLVMTAHPGKVAGADQGLPALVMLLRLNGLRADPDQIRHRLGGATIGIPEMLRCAKEFGIKARARRTSWSRLAHTPLPAIAALRDGGFLLFGKASDKQVLVQRPLSRGSE